MIHLELHALVPLGGQRLRYNQVPTPFLALKHSHARSPEQASTQHILDLVFHATKEKHRDRRIPVHRSDHQSGNRVPPPVERR